MSTTEATKESEICNFVGLAIMAIGLVTGLILILVFGRIEVVSTYRVEKIWSTPIIITGVGAILNGLILGYLFQKIGSILSHLENIKSKT